MNWKYIIILIIVIGGYGYYYWQTSKQEIPEQKDLTFQPIDETLDWKTYRNEKYGYEFKYSPDYSVEDEFTSIRPYSSPAGESGMVMGSKQKIGFNTYDKEEMKFFLSVPPYKTRHTLTKEEKTQTIYDLFKKKGSLDKELAFIIARNECNEVPGPIYNYYYSDLVEAISWINNYGIKGYEIYLTQVDTLTKDKKTWGPVFVLDISRSNNPIFICFNPYPKISEVDKEDLLKILNPVLSSFRLVEIVEK